MTNLLCTALMIKNENFRIIPTLDSIKNFTDLIIILDTGSTDNTIKIIEGYKKTINVDIQIFQEPFVDYSTSRNKLLEYCQDKSKYVLLLDCCDIVKNGYILKNFLSNYEEDALFYCRFLSVYSNGIRKSFPRIALIKNNNYPLICYKQDVHEYIQTTEETMKYNNDLLSTPFIIEHSDIFDKPSKDRFNKDINYLTSIPENAYVCYCLCQTFQELGNYESLLLYSVKLISYKTGDYNEYVFQGLMYKGIAEFYLKGGDYNITLLQAHNYSKKYLERCEPLLMLSIFNVNDKKFDDAYRYIDAACKIKRPTETDDKIIVDHNIYDSERWKVMLKLNEMKYKLDIKKELEQNLKNKLEDF